MYYSVFIHLLNWRAPWLRSILETTNKAAIIIWMQIFVWTCFWISWVYTLVVHPRFHSSKGFACQCRRCRFDPWVGKIPWRWKWQPTSLFLPEKFHGQRTCQATVHGVTKSRTWQMTMYPSSYTAGLYGKIIFNFRRIYQTVLLSGNAIF